MTSAQERYNSTLSRIDAVLDQQAARLEAAEAKAAAERDFERAQKMRDAAEARRQIQATYSDAYRGFGSECPMPVDDESPSRYRVRLFYRLARRLPSDHKLSSLRADDFGSSQPQVFDVFEEQLLEAAMLEGASPSEANLPPNGEMIMRIRGDDSNSKQIEWHGRESFIKGMSRPGRRVLRICDPKSGRVLLGQPFSSAG